MVGRCCKNSAVQTYHRKRPLPRRLDPKLKRNWTHNQLKIFKHQDVRYDVHSDQLLGLKLRVYPTGRKVWVVDYRYEGRRRTYTIGPFPQLSYSQARDNATKAFAENPDPATAKAEKKAELKRKTLKATTDTVRGFLESTFLRPLSGSATRKLSSSAPSSPAGRHSNRSNGPGAAPWSASSANTMCGVRTS